MNSPALHLPVEWIEPSDGLYNTAIWWWFLKHMLQKRHLVANYCHSIRCNSIGLGKEGQFKTHAEFK